MYNGKLKLTNKTNLTLALSNNFDAVFSLIDEVEECNSAKDFLSVANNYYNYKQVWEIDKDCDRYTRLKCKNLLGEIDYLIAEKENVKKYDKLFNVIGKDDVTKKVFARCTSYEKAQKAKEILEAEGFEGMINIRQDEVTIDMFEINGKFIEL